MIYVAPKTKTLSPEDIGELLYQYTEQIDGEIEFIYESGSHGFIKIVSKSPGEIEQVLPLLRQHYSEKVKEYGCASNDCGISC